MPTIAPVLSVVIPTYNEEKRIATTLSRIVTYLESRQQVYEVIVVDDGSTDTTVSIVQGIAKDQMHIRVINGTPNRGKGYAVRCGLLAAAGQRVLFTDADLSTPIESVETLLSWLDKGYDICIASRGLPDSQVTLHQPFYRERMGKIFNRIVRLSLGLSFMDTQCGFKCLRAEVVRHLVPILRVNRFGFDVELLYVARRYGYTIKEAGVQWRNSPLTKVSLIIDPIKMLGAIPKILFNHITRRYQSPLLGREADE